ncbi:dynein regulatory complex subunit 4-like isoform X2 [Siniperca chuatsi]|uniref:dynein regulatory complex subunit 4-like isoform X2 n=1 Tax=Siniperca chuatsi TaxID=119488 RepID=UPI001CE2275F|nr:dynein regulatory complex subunit 4-like isoform X2 [Siniperca chuatsi]
MKNLSRNLKCNHRWRSHINALIDDHNKAFSENFDHKVRKQRQKELKELKLECKELDQKISKVQLDRDNLHKTFTENIQKVQLKADSNIMRLEKKLKDLTDNVKKTQAQFSSVLSASNVDQSALGGVINKIEEYLDSCNNSIKNLQFRKAQISKAHKDLLLTYEALGVPV